MVSITKSIFIFSIDHNSNIPKYLQIVNLVINAVSNNVLQKGEILPSVNYLCKNYHVSRDTVFKAYSILKDQNIVESVPNKGYFVRSGTKKVLLVLDTFKAYKEVLYHSFIDNLGEDITVDVQFHHYNIDNFKSIINTSLGKYYKYVIMPFNNVEVPVALSNINNSKLLLIDWNVYSSENNNFLFQDFGESFFKVLEEAEELFRKYKKIVFVYPEYTYHPKETLNYFQKFCDSYDFEYEILQDTSSFKIGKDIAYISVSDRILGQFLEQCRENEFEPGVDVGFLSYNETPMKKFIYKGISVISTDFQKLGTKAAEFVNGNEKMQCYIETKLIVRKSL